MYYVENSKTRRQSVSNTIDPDETAHYDQSRLDLQHLQIQLLIVVFGALIMAMIVQTPKKNKHRP